MMTTRSIRKFWPLLAAAFLAASAGADQVARPDLSLVRGADKGAESMAQRCAQAAAEFSGAEQVAFLNQNCSQIYSGRADAGAAKASDDGSVRAFGYQNVLFIKKGTTANPQDQVIAGPNSGLTSIASVSIDAQSGEVFVLNTQPKPAVFAFSSRYSGNVCPLRTLEADGLEGASSVMVDRANDELYVANPQSKAILVFKRTASKEAIDPKASQAVLRKIAGPATRLSAPHAVALDSQNNELFVLDRQESKILVFARLAGGDIAPLRVIEGGRTELLLPEAISYSASSRQIHVINGDGALLRFAATANGNAAPVGR